MRATILYGPRDIRVEDRPDPTILEPTDAIITITAACVCGSDLWPYRGVQQVSEPTPMGHEYCGIVEAVGKAVRTIRPGQFVVGSFAASDNTCAHCQYGYQSSCVHRRVPLRRPGADVPGTTRRRHARRHGRHSTRPPDSEPAGHVRRIGHRLVRRGRGRRQARRDRRGRR